MGLYQENHRHSASQNGIAFVPLHAGIHQTATNKEQMEVLHWVELKIDFWLSKIQQSPETLNYIQ